MAIRTIVPVPVLFGLLAVQIAAQNEPGRLLLPELSVQRCLLDDFVSAKNEREERLTYVFQQDREHATSRIEQGQTAISHVDQMRKSPNAAQTVTLATHRVSVLSPTRAVRMPRARLALPFKQRVRILCGPTANAV